MFRREQRVERQHHDPGTHAAPESNRKIYCVVEEHGQPFLGPQSEIFQRGRKAASARLQLAVAERTLCIDERNFFGKPARHWRIDKIRDRVIRSTPKQIVQHGSIRSSLTLKITRTAD